MSEAEEFFDIEQREPDENEIPSTLPVLPLKETVVFPGSLTPLAIGQDRSVRLVDDVVSDEPRILALVTSRTEDVEEPGWDDLYEIGTAAVVDKMVKVPDGTLRVLVRGLERIRLDRRIQDEPYLAGEFTKVPDVVAESDEVEALTRNVQTLFSASSGSSRTCPRSCRSRSPTSMSRPPWSTSSPRSCGSRPRRSSSSSSTTTSRQRLRELLRLLNRELELLELGSRRSSRRCSRRWRRASASSSSASS